MEHLRDGRLIRYRRYTVAGWLNVRLYTGETLWVRVGEIVAP